MHFLKCYAIFDSRLQFMSESVQCLVIFYGVLFLLKLQIESSGIHQSRYVPYLKSQVTAPERSREDGETRRDAPLLLIVT